MKRTVAVGIAVLTFLLTASLLWRAGPDESHPAPTEHRLTKDAEKVVKNIRKEWMEKMHAAAPGTDWRAIEKENGLALQDLRNRAEPPRVSRWTEIGSRNLAGRMHAAALSADGDSIYGGSSLGGVWKGSIDGEGWRPLSDNLYGGAHGIAVADGPPEIVTAITDGGQVRYTDDGGTTWLTPIGPADLLQECKRVLRDRAEADRIYLLVRATVSSSKLWRSDDGGRNYTRIARLSTSPADIWLDRVTGGDLYLMMGNQALRTSDQGVTWDTLGVLPVAAPSNVVLTGSEEGAPTLYAAALNGANWELYRSEDAGMTWEYRYLIDDFWETLTASITDRDMVLFAGVEMWRSIDGGGSFARKNFWYDYYDDPVNMLHADFPGADCVWIPGTGERFYLASDGGLYKSDDLLATVTNISLDSLAVSQYYSTLTSANDPDLILAGAQDQGYQRSTGAAIGNWRDFDQLWSGDYGHMTSSDGTHGFVYSVYPGFLLRQEGEANPSLSSHDFPAGASYNVWMPYVLADPEDAEKCYFCGDRLYHYRFGAHGAIIDASIQDFTVAGGSFLSSFNVSPVNANRRIGCMNNGILWYTSDGGATWNVSPDTGPSQGYLYGTEVAFSPADEWTAYVGGSGYSGSGVYRTVDGGVSWEPVGDGLPSTMVYEISFEGTGSGLLYAATEAGPYRFDPAIDTWSYIGGAEAPLTTFWSVEAVPAAGVVRFGTYGRGIWDYATDDAATDIAGADLPLPTGRVMVNFPNPFNPTTTIRFVLDEAGPYTLSIYDVTGRRVRLLASGTDAAGEREEVWDGRNDAGRPSASGVYTARLESNGRAKVRRMVLAR